MRKTTYIKIHNNNNNNNNNNNEFMNLNKNSVLKMGLILNFERFISILQVSDRK